MRKVRCWNYSGFFGACPLFCFDLFYFVFVKDLRSMKYGTVNIIMNSLLDKPVIPKGLQVLNIIL